MENPHTMPSYMTRQSDGENYVLANDGKYYNLYMLKHYPEGAHVGYTTQEISWMKPSKKIGIKAFFTVRLVK